jgi:hypothetical protein
MRDRLEGAGGGFDVFVLVDQCRDLVFIHDGAGRGKAVV